jgi:hypothetical protein
MPGSVDTGLQNRTAERIIHDQGSDSALPCCRIVDLPMAACFNRP